MDDVTASGDHVGSPRGGSAHASGGGRRPRRGLRLVEGRVTSRASRVYSEERIVTFFSFRQHEHDAG